MTTITPAQIALRTLRTTHALFLLSILFYAFAGERMMQHPVYTGGRTFVVSMTTLAAALFALAFFVRSFMVTPHAQALREHPSDMRILKRWQMGTLISLALAEAVALCGVPLRAAGLPLSEAVPFYAVGGILMLFWRPTLNA